MAGLITVHKKLFPFLALLALIFTGCAGPLEVKYEPKTEGQFKSGEPVPVFVASFEDKRDLSKSPFKDPRTLGSIESTVTDMTASELTLSEDVTDTVEGAYKKELAIAGFTVVNEPDKALYAVSGEVREFRLDIGSRDLIAIEIASEFKAAETNKPIWSGVESEQGERFAGVMGNSRASISNYIAASLQKTIRRSIAAAGENLAKAEKMPATEKSSVAPSTEATGTVAVNTTPQRSKVYIDGVYYGLTPLSLGLAPGIYEITLKQKGFHTVTEKVSVRQDRTTELETELEKE
jgi:hypothetical protein